VAGGEMNPVRWAWGCALFGLTSLSHILADPMARQQKVVAQVVVADMVTVLVAMVAAAAAAADILM